LLNIRSSLVLISRHVSQSPCVSPTSPEDSSTGWGVPTTHGVPTNVRHWKAGRHPQEVPWLAVSAFPGQKDVGSWWK